MSTTAGVTCEQAATGLRRLAGVVDHPFQTIGTAALSGIFNPHAVRAKQELEEAAMRVVALCSSVDMVHVAVGEAKRREALMTPTQALRSVADDLMTGRLA